jgi:uncharacterized protein (TIGR03084 family)
MPVEITAILADLRAEHEDLDRLLAPLEPGRWDTPTPAEGWTVRDQVSHLAFFDERARTAMTDPERFMRELAHVLEDPDAFAAAPIDEGRSMPVDEVLASWRRRRRELLDAVAAADPTARVPWYGPAMSLASFATARLMETWVHGQDVADGLGLERQPTARLRHVAHIAVRARPFNYASHGRELPDVEVHVVLRAPDGSAWTWNDPASPQRVSGDALDFCLVATQRRHVADTGLTVDGPLAQEWMGIAQAFAGPPGPGRRPGQFARSRGAG